MNPPGHTRFIVGCITTLSLVAMCLGAWLLAKGYQSGELLVTNGGVGGISGLVGFLGGKAIGDKLSQAPDSTPTPPKQAPGPG